MRYSDEFKNHVVSRLLTGEVTIPQAQVTVGGGVRAVADF